MLIMMKFDYDAATGLLIFTMHCIYAFYPYRNKIAISDVNGDYLYEDVYMRSWDLAKGIIGLLGDNNQGKRICFLCPSGLTHVITSWACWMSGNVAVPLCPSSDKARLEHLVMDSACSVVVTTKDQVRIQILY